MIDEEAEHIFFTGTPNYGVVMPKFNSSITVQYIITITTTERNHMHNVQYNSNNACDVETNVNTYNNDNLDKNHHHKSQYPQYVFIITIIIYYR